MLSAVLTTAPLGAQEDPPVEPNDVADAWFEVNLDDPSSDDDFVAGEFSDEITVSVISVVARIVDPYGELIRDLRPEELEAKIDGVAVGITAVDFHLYRDDGLEATSAQIPQEQRRELLDLPDLVPTSEVPGRQIIIVMQIGGHDVITLEPSYVRGHQQSLPGLKELIDGLQSNDRVALFSFDARLKLWLDFTHDHEKVKSHLFDTIGFATPPLAKPATDGPSLVKWIRSGRLEDATSPGESMAVLADALRHIEGSKDIIYVGWDVTGYRGIISRLQRSDAVVSVLDVTQADRHLLESPLQAVAVNTGGTYESLYKFPKRGPRRLARSIAGHHTITLDLDVEGELSGILEILVPGRDAKVHMKSYAF